MFVGFSAVEDGHLLDSADHDDGGNALLRIVHNYLLVDTASFSEIFVYLLITGF